MRLKGPRVVFEPVGSASVGTQMKSMEPWIWNGDWNSTIGVSQTVRIGEDQIPTKVKREPIMLMERESSRREYRTTMIGIILKYKL